ncbi:MAG: sulfotransferase [Rhizomicrobium sp.]|jgi:hypothetical protein
MAPQSGSTDICFLIGRPRSGTTVFRSMLESHPALLGMGEVFNEANPKSYFHFLQKRVTVTPEAVFPGRSVTNFRDFVASCRRTLQQSVTGGRFVILDVKYDQSHLLCEPWWGITFLPRIFSLIRDEGWLVIDIHRNDHLAMYVSNLLAIESKVYHSTDPGAGSVTRKKLRLDAAAVARQLTITNQAYRRVSNHFARYAGYLCVTYEEMFDPGAGFRPELLERVSAFLGIDNAFDQTPRLARLLGEDALSYVENADEVRDVLRRLEQ